MVSKWLPSCGTPSRITSDLDMKKTELDFNPYVYSLLVQLNCHHPQAWHLFSPCRREKPGEVKGETCALTLFLIHQYLLTYV